MAGSHPHRPALPAANGSTLDAAAAAAAAAGSDAPTTARRRSGRMAAAADSGTAAGAGKPVTPAAAAHRTLQWRRLWGMAACFVASGIAHEIIFV